MRGSRHLSVPFLFVGLGVIAEAWHRVVYSILFLPLGFLVCPDEFAVGRVAPEFVPQLFAIKIHDDVHHGVLVDAFKQICFS